MIRSSRHMDRMYRDEPQLAEPVKATKGAAMSPWIRTALDNFMDALEERGIKPNAETRELIALAWTDGFRKSADYAKEAVNLELDFVDPEYSDGPEFPGWALRSASSSGTGASK